MLSLNLLHAQQYDVMYFGDEAGLDFSSGTPVALTNSSMVAAEACSTISDSLGSLLFYTDGMTIWNNNHNVMLNGSGLNGAPSTAQTIILPQPGNTDLYYVFTLDEFAGAKGMCYSVVDMTLDGGNGAVMSSKKNVLVRSSMTEKIAAVKRCDGNYWIVTHAWGSNVFYSDLLDNTGFSTVQTSSVGTIHQSSGGSSANMASQMCFSSDGKKIANAIRNIGVYEVFDFNLTTGVLSNVVTLNPGTTPLQGVAFSPDVTKLYGSNGNPGKLYQYDLLAGNSSQINASKSLISNLPNLAGHIFSGKDGKLYLSQMMGQYSGKLNLGVINNPNQLGSACNFVQNGFYLAGKKCLVGVPNFPVVVNSSNIELKDSIQICSGDTVDISINVNSGDLIQWSGGGISNNTNTVSVFPNISTTYFVSITSASSSCTVLDSVLVDVFPKINASLPFNRKTVCKGDTVEIVPVVSSGAVYNYEWSRGVSSSSKDLTLSPSTSSYYVLKITNGGVCSWKDSLFLEVIDVQDNLLPADTSSCGEVDLEIVGNYSSILWNNSYSGNIYHVDSTSAVVVQAIDNVTGCLIFDTINVFIGGDLWDSLKPSIIFPSGGCYNDEISFSVKNSKDYFKYKWTFSNGASSQDSNPIISFQREGNYKITLEAIDTLCGEKVFFDTTFLKINTLIKPPLIANTFTPNGDGLNDIFKVYGGSCGMDNMFQIYNRWGGLIYSTTEPFDEFWDGNLKGSQCPEGVYVYILKVDSNVYKGHITLLR